jgi:hypothetical protein
MPDGGRDLGCFEALGTSSGLLAEEAIANGAMFEELQKLSPL